MTISTEKDALLSQFSVLAYRDRSFLDNPANLPAGWTVKDDSVSPPFAAFAFQNNTTGEVVIAYRGTDGLPDGRTDVGCSPVSYINMPRGAINDCNWRKAA